jgi:glyoxylase-like metal-dependent hydrolase (beta-lactamase superfamily II)
MKIETLTLGPAATNCYILWTKRGGPALVIDPASEADAVLAFLRDHELRVAAYPITHGHVDHVSALAEVRRAFPAPVALHPADQAWAFQPINQLPPFLSTPEAPDRIERDLAEGQTWTDAGWTYRVLHLPGHTPGGVGFYFEQEGILFAGDTLFAGSVGRVDLPGGNARLLTQSLNRLVRLPDATTVYPGHGGPTTIGAEKQTNYFMRYGVPA